jgi:MFS family permease
MVRVTRGTEASRAASRCAAMRRAARSTFGGLPAAFWWVWLGTLVNRMGAFILPFLAFYITGPLHRSAALAGLVTSLYGLGACVSGVIGGILTDRVGRKPTMLVSLFANAASIAGLGYAHSPMALGVGALVVGLVANAYRPAVSAMIADVVPDRDRVRAYSLNFWAINLGFSVSMTLMGVVVMFGYKALFLGDAASTVLCAVLIGVFVRDTTPTAAIKAAAVENPGAGMRTVLRDRTYVAFVLAMLVVLIVYGQCNAAMPMAMAKAGISTADYGRIGAINGILIVVLQLPLTRWFKRFPQARVLAVSSAVIGLGYAIILFGDRLGIFALSTVIWTLGEIGNTPTSSSIVARMALTELRGRYQGLYQLSWSGSAVLAPLVGGTLFTEFGGTPVWIGCVGLAGAAGLMQLRIGGRVERKITATTQANEMRTREQKREQEQGREQANEIRAREQLATA